MSVYIQSFLFIALEILCCQIFFEAFGKKRTEENRWRNYGIIIGLMAFEYFAAMLLEQTFVLRQVISIIGIALFMVFYLKISCLKSVMLSALFHGLLIVIDYFVILLNVLFFHNVSKTGESYGIEEALLIILGRLFLFIIVLMMRKHMGKASFIALSDTEWLRFIFLPLFTICITVAMITTSGSIENRYEVDIFLMIAFCLAGMNIAVFYLINDILLREAEIRESRIFKIQVENQINMYRSVSENFDKQRKKTHEYKNQILCIESLISKKDYSELEEYVRNISGHLSEELDAIHTNNVIVDAVLNSKYQEMLNKNIVFVFKINDLSKITISDEDIVVILSNLLNNAMEACEQCPDKKCIKMKFVTENDNVIISVKNTYVNEIIYKNGEIQTSKKHELDEHGIGIKNIADTIAKYGGSYVIQNDEKEFYFSIMIPQ